MIDDHLPGSSSMTGHNASVPFFCRKEPAKRSRRVALPKAIHQFLGAIRVSNHRQRLLGNRSSHASLSSMSTPIEHESHHNNITLWHRSTGCGHCRAGRHVAEDFAPRHRSSFSDLEAWRTADFLRGRTWSHGTFTGTFTDAIIEENRQRASCANVHSAVKYNKDPGERQPPTPVQPSRTQPSLKTQARDALQAEI